jgi:hypothetical protein
MLGTFNLTENVVPTITPPHTSSTLRLKPQITAPKLRQDTTTISSNVPDLVPKPTIIRGSQFASSERANSNMQKRQSWTCSPNPKNNGPRRIVRLPAQKVSPSFICSSYNGADCPLAPTEVVRLHNTLTVTEPIIGPFSYERGQDSKL